MKTKDEIFDEVMKALESIALYSLLPWEYQTFKDLEREYWAQTPSEED